MRAAQLRGIGRPVNNDERSLKPIEALRTPDTHLQDLPGYPFEPHYAGSLPGYEGLRADYLWGPKDARRTFLIISLLPYSSNEGCPT